MLRKHTSNPAFPTLTARLMDVRLIALTAGTSIVANMLFPGLGSSAIGAVLGALFGFQALKPDQS